MEYTTGELIQLLENFKTESLADWIVNVDVDVFIEKLQAADKLCEAAKGLVSSCTPELYDEYFEATKKAIAEYEGKEGK
jgi:signal recognition particle GTPase